MSGHAATRLSVPPKYPGRVRAGIYGVVAAFAEAGLDPSEAIRTLREASRASDTGSGDEMGAVLDRISAGEGGLGARMLSAFAQVSPEERALLAGVDMTRGRECAPLFARAASIAAASQRP